METKTISKFKLMCAVRQPMLVYNLVMFVAVYRELNRIARTASTAPHRTHGT